MHAEGRKFNVGDEVYSGRFGEGFVTDVDDNALYIYPIHVQWKNSSKRSIFTPEGRYNVRCNDPDVDICFLKAGQFKVGDHVISKHFGDGVVTHIADPEMNKYPVQVSWTGIVPRSCNSCEYYTPEGKFSTLYPQPDYDITHIEEGDDEEDESTVERMEDALNKKVEDAVNPAHYKVEGLPEAIDIIKHLMQREQYEGFLWGNIIKYTYRYGRKGDKAETAGKIKWYAQKLKELGECESK